MPDLVRFGIVWLSSLVSGVGSSLTGFVLGVWVYQNTESTTLFALVMLSGLLPAILVGPFAGVIVDRFDRRRVLIISDCVVALSTGAQALLLYNDALQVWHICLGSFVGAVCGTLHMTTYQAMTPLLIPERHLARANGLMQITMATQIAAPLAAGALLAAIGMTGVLVLDLVTFAIAVTTLLVVKLPASVVRAPGAGSAKAPLSDLSYGWHYLRRRGDLMRLTLTFTAYNFCFAVAGVLVQPLILSFGSPAVLGALMFAGGSGVFLGGIVMGLWGGPKKRVRGMGVFMLLGSVFLVLHTLQPNPWLVAGAAAAFLFTLPVVQGSGNAVLQSRIEPDSLGRVLGTVHTIGGIGSPFAYLLAGPLAEFVAGPLLRDGGALAGNVGRLIGTGEGRGIALVILVDALILAVVAVTVLLRKEPAPREKEEVSDAVEPATA
ncbi:MFS transporter [Herbidospora sp. NEAU-GS84]|uniref:MFS transporter n=1 Tax=Herbidospora solisilvae TaxID=2696284 RepID=A0A7C9NKI3_9ACTN|nr:MFS transporter [Herbidospora solisilvae]NAS24872.1 MFS transporter [Herbidospora solisilvae]